MYRKPPKGKRQSKWEQDYRLHGSRANLRRDLAFGPNRLTSKQYREGEIQRVKQGVALAKIELWAINSYYDRFPSLAQIKPKLVVEMCSGDGHIAAEPGNLAVEACRLGYAYLAIDFARWARVMWRKRVKGAFRKRGLRPCKNVQVQYGRMHEVLAELPDQSVDIMIIFQALQHCSVEELHSICRELPRVMKPWGRVILQLPCLEDNDPDCFSERTILWPFQYLEAKLKPLQLLEKHVVPVFDNKELGTFAVFGNAVYTHRR